MASWGSGAGEGVSANPSIYPAHRSFMCKTHFRVVLPFGTLLIEIIQPKKNKTRKKIKSVPSLTQGGPAPPLTHTTNAIFFLQTPTYSSIVSTMPEKIHLTGGAEPCPYPFLPNLWGKTHKTVTFQSLTVFAHAIQYVYGINELFDIMELI